LQIVSAPEDVRFSCMMLQRGDELAFERTHKQIYTCKYT